MKFVLGLSIVLLITMSSPSAKATDSWTLYDDFNSEFLDIEKWGESQTRTGGVVALEEVREIEGQRLYMLIRANGPTQPPPPGMHRGDKAITFLNPNTIRGVKASIKVNELEATQCPDPGVQPTRARARFSGSFYNTGLCTSPSGQSCDVAAQILIQRLSNSQGRPGILEILGEVFECVDSSCFGNRNYQPVPLGTIRVGQWATVSVEWSYAAKQFIFQLDEEPPQVIPYNVPVASPPNVPFKQLGVSPRIPYCPSERQVGFIGADFENVFVK